MTIVTRYGARHQAPCRPAQGAGGAFAGDRPDAVGAADLLAAHEIFRALGEPRSQAIVLQNLGSIYLEARDFERALRYYEQANETYPDDPALTLTAHNNRGNALKELRRYAEAEREFGWRSRPRGRSTATCCRRASSPTSPRPRRCTASSPAPTPPRGAAWSISAALGGRMGAFLWGVRAQIALARGDLPTARGYIERTFDGVDLGQSTMPYREFHDVARQIYIRPRRRQPRLPPSRPPSSGSTTKAATSRPRRARR